MDWKAHLARSLPPLGVDPALERDILEELAAHCADRYDECLARGRSENAARDAVLEELKDAGRLVREIRAARVRPRQAIAPPAGGRGLAGLGQDLRYAVRRLRRSPGFAATAVLTLALGIGANTAIFSVVSATLLRPLPFADPNQLVVVGQSSGREPASPVGFLTAVDWRERSRTLADLALVSFWTPTLDGAGGPERLSALKVSSNYFRMLGVRLPLGRDFSADDDRPDHWRVVLLSDALWRRRFGAGPGVVGRSITMNDRRYTVIGVLPANFEPVISGHFYEPAEMWAPLGYDASLPYACRSCQHLRAIARLRPGVGAARAQVEINTIQSQLRVEHPNEYGTEPVVVVPLHDEVAGQSRRILLVLMGAVAFVLLVACANLANLLLARASERRRELSVRAALGAPRRRLVRQLMVESAVLAAAGGIVGLGVAHAGIRALVSLAPAWIPRVDHSTIDLPTLGITAGLMLLCTAAFGLLPAWHATRMDLAGALSGGGRVVRQSSHRIRRAIVTCELAVSLVLLAGAVLMIRTVGTLLAVDPGFDSHGVLATRLEFSGARYNTDERLVAAMDSLLERIATLPGVDAAALASQVPLGGNFDRYGFHVQGRVAANPELDPSLERYGVTPGYFRVMRIPLRRGRVFARSDAHGGAAVLLVNETAARTLFPGEDPVGKLVRVGPSDSGPWRTIVGVVGDVRHEELSRPASMQFYVPESQFVDSSLTLVVRGAIGASGFESALRQAVLHQAPGVPMYATSPLDDLVRRTVAPRRFIMLLLSLFAAVATTLAALGLYGVVAGLAAERRQEIGVRIALGATSRDIVRLVLGSGLPLVAWGLALGLVSALWLNRALAAFLFGVTPTDAGTLSIVAVGLGVVGIAAHAVPAMRAARVHPSATLRQE